jgi:hypothetical protein
MDTPPGDDHISVKKNELTHVKVKLYGIDDGSMLHFTSSDTNIVVAGAALLPSPSGGFILEVMGKDKDKSEAKIQARLGTTNGPICGEISVSVFKEKTISKWNIYCVTDPTSPGTSPLTALNSADIKSNANAIVKQAVMKFENVDVVETNINYDVDKSGALEYFYDGGAQTEYSIIQGAGLAGNPKVVSVRNVNFAWRLSANSATGQANIVVIGIGAGGFISNWVGSVFTLGSGASSENVTLLSVAGTNLTFAVNLSKEHSAGERLIATFGAGVGADPQIVEDGGLIQTTLLHETLHRPDIGNLNDVVSALNIMNHSVGPGHTELRYKDLPKPAGYGGGVETNQWSKIPRP